MKNFLVKLKNRKIIVSLIMSYILILLVPYFVNRISYVSMENNLMDEIKNYNSEYLSGRVQTLDATIANVSEIVDAIFLNEDFRQAATLKAPLTASQRYQISTDNSYIYAGFDFYVENLFVIFKNADYYVGKNGAGNLENFYEAHYSKQFTDYKTWYDFMTKNYYGELVVYPRANPSGDGSVFYAISYMDVGDSDNLLANIIVEFKKSFLLSDNNESNRFFMIDEHNRVIVSEEDEGFVAILNEALVSLPKDNVVSVKYQGQNRILMVQDLVQSNWKYVSSISEDAFMEKIVSARRNYIYCLLICILLGGIIIFWAVKKHYLPIKKMTKALSQDFEYDAKLDEYQYLISTVSKVTEKYRTDTQYQKLEKKLAKNSLLLSVLKGEELQHNVFSRLNYFGIKFQNPCFSVAQITVEDCSQLFFEGEESQNNIVLAKLIIENVMEDLLKDRFEVAFCENAEDIYMVCSFASSDLVAELQERLIEAQKIIQSVSNVHFFMSLSTVYEEFHNISVCYREAAELMRFCKIRNDKFLSYSDYLNLNRTEDGQYFYSADMEQKLISYLMYGNYEKAAMVLSEVVEQNLNHVNGASLKGKCLFFDIGATVLKTIRQNEMLSSREELSKADWLMKINDYESVSEIKEEILKVFEQICAYTRSVSVRTTERLTDDIIEFVKEEYHNSNLNVAFISEKFNVSANYVSTVFKKEAGIPLSEYINAVRIEHARELLYQTNLKVAEISEQVGFASFRTFSRVFHSIVGIPPAEYRKKNHF